MQIDAFWIGNLLFALGCVLATAFVLTKQDGIAIRIKLMVLALFAVSIPFCSHWLYSVLRFGYAFYDKSLAYALLPFQGGFTVYGALFGVVLSMGIVSKASKTPFLKLANAFAAPLFLALAFARFAEGLWFMGYGMFVEIESHMFFPISIYDVSYESWLYAIFVLEGLFALFCGILLINKKKDSFFSALVLYSSMQIIFESMRQDEILRWGFVLCNQVIAAIFLVFVFVYYCKKITIGYVAITLFSLVMLSCFGMIATMEFALESRVPLFISFTRLHCYAMDLACVGIINAIIFYLQRKTKPE